MLRTSDFTLVLSCQSKSKVNYCNCKKEEHQKNTSNKDKGLLWQNHWSHEEACEKHHETVDKGKDDAWKAKSDKETSPEHHEANFKTKIDW